MELTRLRGFQDLLGPQARTLAYVEERARILMERYAVEEIRIPLLERIELYQRSTGETSDIVSKQMYTFTDHDEAETTLALRPEGTPGVVRAYIEAGLDRSDPEQRFFYSGPMFRRERPQKGRYRQFHQFGVEVFGRADPACDAELLVMVDDLRRDLGLAFQFEINSLGDAKCRPAFRTALLDYGRAHFSELCSDCHERLERNPLRLLDCKIDVKLAEAAPKSLDYLCPECRQHFDTVIDLLNSAGVEFRDQSADRARAGLLHEDDLRNHFDQPRLAERSAGWRPLRRTGRGAGRCPGSRDRVRNRHGAAGVGSASGGKASCRSATGGTDRLGRGGRAPRHGTGPGVARVALARRTAVA